MGLKTAHGLEAEIFSLVREFITILNQNCIYLISEYLNLMKINLVFKNITLEPVLFFMSIVGSMDSVSVGQLLIDKSCQNHFHYSDEICDNLLNDTNEHYNAQVENDVAQYKVKFT